MTTVSKSILFVGVSSMQLHAGQHKLYFIADEFGRRGIPVTVLVPDLDDNRDFLSTRSHIRARYYKPGSALSDAWQKSRVIQEGCWSAAWIVGVGLRSYVARGITTRGIPIIRDFDEFPSMIETFGPLRRAYLRLIESRSIAQADAFTCASAYLELSIRRRRPRIGARLLKLPVAISAEEHRIDPELVKRLRKSSSDRPILLYVGTVSRIYEEQLDEIIKLAALLQARKSNGRVRIAGTGADLDYFKSKAAASQVGDSLEFVGHVRRKGDLAGHMDAADVLIFPFPANDFNLSRCPTKAYHYAAANRPLVTNRTGEVAALFGDAALYYPDHDVEAFADRCQQALALTPAYDNRIALTSLTWEARAQHFEKWLSTLGWLPSETRTAAPRERDTIYEAR